MALDAGSVFAVLGGKFNPAGFAQFDAAMKKSTASAAAAEKSHNRTAGAMTAMGTAAKTGAAVGVIAVGYALVESVKSAATFEKKMSELQAVTKASAATMKTMGKAALDLGAQTGVGAIEAAGALTELAKGGLDANTSIAALKGTIALAQAGDMQLADAANTVVKSLSLFSLKGADAGHVADGLASAANATSMDVKDFAMALAQGGSAAAAAGFSFDDTINVMAAMANKFQSGSDMGTSLKTTLVQMAHPSKQAATEMQRLGISIFKANGEIKPVASIVSMLGDRFKGMSDKQKLSTAATIAGTDGMRTLLALLGGSGKDIIVPGSAAEIAAKKMDNYTGATKRLSAEIESLKIEAGQGITPALADATNAVTKFLEQMRKGEGLGGIFSSIVGVLWDVQKAFYSVVTGAGTAFIALLEGIARAGAFFGVPGAEKAADDLTKMRRELAQTTQELLPFQDAAKKPVNVKLAADKTAAINAIKDVQNSKIAPKVAKILGEKKDADSKIKALIALGIPEKTARVLAETGSAEAALARVRRDLANISSKTVTLTVNKVGDAVGNLFSGKASGARAGTAQTAIVGEGGGPEWIVDRSTGKARRVGSAQITSLNANEYVIPTESKYRPQALSLLSMLAADLGVAGFAKGKKPLQVGKPKGQTLTTSPGKGKVPRYIPERVFAAHDLSWFDNEISKRDAIKDNKKGNKLTAAALKARKEIADLKKQQSSAKGYLAQINRLQTDADIDRDLMTTADNKDDQAGYNSAFNNRKTALGSLQGKLKAAYDLAVKYAPNSTWTQSLKGQLAALGVSLSEMPANPETITPGAVDETTYSADEQKQLDELGRQLAMAELTPQLTDDQAALAGKASLLSSILSGAGNGAGRGGVTAVTQIASELKSTRDQIAGLAGGTSSAPDIGTPGITPDQQAQLDQTARNQTMAAQSAAIDRLVGATMGGSPTLVFQSYVPPSPTEARRLADYTVGGIGYQGATQSSKDSVGI